MKTPYEELGVPKDATEEQIKKAWRKRRGKAHPDKDGGSNDEFVKARSAYLLLSDPERRKKYDETGDTQESDVDSEYEQLLQEMATLVLSIAHQVPDNVLPTFDLMREITAHCTKTRQEINKVIAHKETLVVKLGKFDARIKRKKECGENMMHKFITAQIEQYKIEIQTARDALVKLGKFEAMFDGYTYDFDDLDDIVAATVAAQFAQSAKRGFR